MIPFDHFKFASSLEFPIDWSANLIILIQSVGGLICLVPRVNGNNNGEYGMQLGTVDFSRFTSFHEG